MRRAALVFGLLAAGAAVAGESPAGMKRVAGKVILSVSICGGGAAITREQLARLPPPQPIAGKELLVVAGDQVNASRPAARIVTRADGTFVTHLPPGKWCFFDAARRPSEPRDRSVEAPGRPRPVEVTSAGIDAGCLDAERRRCDLVLAVRADVSKAEITFIQPCPQEWNQPCYRGPMPP